MYDLKRGHLNSRVSLVLKKCLLTMLSWYSWAFQKPTMIPNGTLNSFYRRLSIHISCYVTCRLTFQVRWVQLWVCLGISDKKGEVRRLSEARGVCYFYLIIISGEDWINSKNRESDLRTREASKNRDLFCPTFSYVFCIAQLLIFFVTWCLGGIFD